MCSLGPFGVNRTPLGACLLETLISCGENVKGAIPSPQLLPELTTRAAGWERLPATTSGVLAKAHTHWWAQEKSN